VTSSFPVSAAVELRTGSLGISDPGHGTGSGDPDLDHVTGNGRNGGAEAEIANGTGTGNEAGAAIVRGAAVMNEGENQDPGLNCLIVLLADSIAYWS